LYFKSDELRRAGDVKDSQIIIGHQDPPQFILQDRETCARNFSIKMRADAVVFSHRDNYIRFIIAYTHTISFFFK